MEKYSYLFDSNHTVEHYNHKRTVDIIYSVTVHEHPDSVIDMIKNIIYFHPSFSVFIILHANKHLSDVLPPLLKGNTNVMVNPIAWDHRDGVSVTKKHIENIQWCHEHINASYFIMLASNCLFHKNVTQKDIVPDPAAAVAYSSHNDNQHNAGKWRWPELDNNKKLLQACRAIDKWYAVQHEGMVIPYSKLYDIHQFIVTNVLDNITYPTVLEEMLFGTIYKHQNGIFANHLCKIFWNSPGINPSVREIIECPEPCVKRIDRDFDSPVRSWLRSTNNYYLG